MNPISWFVVLSTSATGALLFAMGSRSVGLVVCAVTMGLYRWFRTARLEAKDHPVVRVDERQGDADPKQPATLPLLQGTASSPGFQIGT